MFRILHCYREGKTRIAAHTNKDEMFMGLALDEARKAMAEGEVPIGAVLIEGQDVISKGHNHVEGSKDPTAHAEIRVIRKAAQKLDRWRLTDTTLYVSVEPCCMCIGAIILARIDRLVYGIEEPKTGFCRSQVNLIKTAFPGYGLSVESGVLAEEARTLMQAFFKKLRRGTEVWP